MEREERGRNDDGEAGGELHKLYDEGEHPSFFVSFHMQKDTTNPTPI